MLSINYANLIMDLSDQAFSQCIDLLPDIFSYIPKGKVRRVDLCEKVHMLSYEKQMHDMCEDRYHGSWREYVDTLEYYIKNYLLCKKGTKADKYRNYALKLTKELKGTTSIPKLETLFAIFLALARAQHPHKYNDFRIESLQLFVSIKDSTVLLWLNKSKYLDSPLIATHNSKIDWSRRKELLYIHNVILLCRLLQTQGDFNV